MWKQDGDSGTEEEDKQPISPTSITVLPSHYHMLNIKTEKKKNLKHTHIPIHITSDEDILDSRNVT